MELYAGQERNFGIGIDPSIDKSELGALINGYVFMESHNAFFNLPAPKEVVNGNSPVPVPSTFYLLAPGVVGLIGVARRTREKKNKNYFTDSDRP